MDRPDPSSRLAAPLPYRRLPILDLIGVVLAIGLAFGGWRATRPLFLRSGGTEPFGPILRWVPDATVVGMLALLALAGWVTIRSLVLPRVRQAQVGIMACWAALLAGHLNAAGQLLDQWPDLFLVRPFDVMQGQTSSALIVGDAYLRLVRTPGPIATGILVAALVAWRTGTWQRSADGLDLLGRRVAVGLLLISLATTTMLVLQVTEVLPWGWGRDG